MSTTRNVTAHVSTPPLAWCGEGEIGVVGVCTLESAAEAMLREEGVGDDLVETVWAQQAAGGEVPQMDSVEDVLGALAVAYTLRHNLVREDVYGNEEVWPSEAVLTVPTHEHREGYVSVWWWEPGGPTTSPAQAETLDLPGLG